MWFEIYESNKRDHEGRLIRCEWHWRLRSRNGRIVADSGEGYATKAGVLRACDRLARVFLRTGARPPIREVES